MATCFVHNCDRRIFGHGYCNAHYSRLQRWGDVRAEIPIGHPSPRLSFESRFWAKIDQSGGPDACWPWMGNKTPHGYGVWRVKITKDSPPKAIIPHRKAYELTQGPIPTDKELDHTCHTQACAVPFNECPHHACCNPTHLNAVSHADNLKRRNNPESIRKAIAASVVVKRARTHCKNGHPFDEANTFYRPDRSRVCRTCKRLYWHRHKQRKILAH